MIKNKYLLRTAACISAATCLACTETISVHAEETGILGAILEDSDETPSSMPSGNAYLAGVDIYPQTETDNSILSAICITTQDGCVPEQNNNTIYDIAYESTSVCSSTDQYAGLDRNAVINAPDTTQDASMIQTSDRTLHDLYNHGVNYGPSGRETYYNLPMDEIVARMRRKGYNEEQYPHYIREDGVHMLGEYVMVVAELGSRPRGTVLETSVGTAIVCDTGSFVEKYPDGIDVATEW